MDGSIRLEHGEGFELPLGVVELLALDGDGGREFADGGFVGANGGGAEDFGPGLVPLALLGLEASKLGGEAGGVLLAVVEVLQVRDRLGRVVRW